MLNYHSDRQPQKLKFVFFQTVQPYVGAITHEGKQS